MDIWIIRNGEKTGPIHDYEVRHKIEDGQLEPTTPAWHEGLPSWMPLGEIDLFKREFQLASTAHEQSAPPEKLPYPPPSLPPPLPQQSILGRRFWARWLDLTLFAGIWWLAMWATGRDIRSTLANPWVMFPHYIPWFILEIFLVHHFGTTPGKWLLGLKIQNLDGSLLNLSEATRRSARVLFTGIGFGWNLLAVFCQVLSYFTAKRLGSPLWDHVGGHKVVSVDLRPERVVAFSVLFVSALLLQFAVMSPYLKEEMVAQAPESKEQIEANPLWNLRLPKRP